jgi:hypothetical protein
VLFVALSMCYIHMLKWMLSDSWHWYCISHYCKNSHSFLALFCWIYFLLFLVYFCLSLLWRDFWDFFFRKNVWVVFYGLWQWLSVSLMGSPISHANTGLARETVLSCCFPLKKALDAWILHLNSMFPFSPTSTSNCEVHLKDFKS